MRKWTLTKSRHRKALVFTAVTLTRLWVAQWLRRARPTEIAL